MMIQIRDKKWVALYFVLICQQVNLSLGYVTGGLRSYRNCIVKNMACSDVDGRAITSISNINNKVSISPTFYERLFRQFSFAKTLETVSP
jgi:hypothetical protein